MSDPRDWRDGEPSDPSRPPEVDLSRRRPFPPRPDGGLPRATEAYRSSLPPRRPATPVLPPPPSRGRGIARALSWIAVVTSVAVLAVSGAGYVLVNHYDGQIDRLPGVFAQGRDRPEAAPSNAENFLIVGSDSRGDLKAGEGVQGSGDNFVSGQRADTVILAHLYGGRSKQAQLISFPRDSYVDIPAFTDPDTGKTVLAHKGKLNSAFFEGGPRLLTQTIEQLSDVRIDHYLQIDFDGFKNMVDELGGVEVCLPKAAKEKDSGIDLPAGRQVVHGDQALAFVRQRKKLPNGDIDRIARQQQFIGAIIRKVLSSGTLLNPFRLNGFLDAATASLQVDEELGISDLRTLAVRLRSFNAGGVSFVTVPITSINGSRKNRDGLFESVVLLDDERTGELFRALRADRPPGVPEPAPTASPAPTLIVAPANIRVRVYNGSDVTGLGSRAATDLAEVGFRIVGAASNRPGTAATTVVLHGPDKADSARTLAAALPGATTQLQPELGSTLEVVIGSTYTGAKAVSVTGTPSRPSSPRASATPQIVTAAEDPCAV